MSKVAIVTDSSAYIPNDILKEYPISVAPQVLIWGNESYEDGVDIQPGEFYTRLKDAKVMPSSSQVTPASFHKIYKRLLDEKYDILAILIAEKLSGTIASAKQAKEFFPDAVIEIFDSNSTAMAMGYQVLAVARALAKGASLQEGLALAENARDHTGVVFTVDTLEFLRRGGRIGGAAAFLATALNIKPILELRDGRIEPIEKVRTRKKALDRLVELVEDRSAGLRPIRLATLHANAQSDAESLLETARVKFDAIESIFSEVSPVIGSHAGPGTVGLAYMAGM
jgi:DegV family protein with EDD domain